MEFSATFLLWAPVALIFLSAIISIFIERHRKDPCLKAFDGDFVVLRMKSGNTLWGTLVVYPDCLELIYDAPVEIDGGRKTSYVLYNRKIAEIERICRPAPVEGTTEHSDWEQSINRLRRPGLFGHLKRFMRNTYSMLRDAFSQSLGMTLGIFKQRSATLKQLGTADKHANEVGQSLLRILPHAYEPVLEKYRGSLVVVESLVEKEIEESMGVLDEYSIHYLLVRAIVVPPAILPAHLKQRISHCCDLVFPRATSIVRHRVAEADTSAPSGVITSACGFSRPEQDPSNGESPENCSRTTLDE